MPKYKFGKITRPIEFAYFSNAMEKGEFKKYIHKSFLVFLFWFGVRISEVLERIKEDFTVENKILIVNIPAKKGGQREALQIDLSLPYAYLILERWKKTRRGRRLWPFTARTGERIVKRAMGEKYYPHFFRLNRSVHFLDDPTTTIPEMLAWFGWKSHTTIDSYIGYSSRHVDRQRERLRREFET